MSGVGACVGGGARLLCPNQGPSYHTNRLASNPYWRYMSAMALSSEKERPPTLRLHPTVDTCNHLPVNIQHQDRNKPNSKNKL